MAVNDADQSRDESTEAHQEADPSRVSSAQRPKEAPNSSRASSGQRPEGAPTPESEAAAIPISEPAAPGVWDAGSEGSSARAERPAERDNLAGAESAVPPMPDPAPAPEPDAGPPPSRDASARPPPSAGPTAGAASLGAERRAGATPYESAADTSSVGQTHAGRHGGADRSAAQAEAPSQLQQHLASRTTWLRLVYMLLFVVLWGLSRIVLGAVIIMQFLWVLLSGENNPRLAALGQTLATYSYEIILYLTYNTERQPFPFSDWPNGPPD